MDKEFIGNQGTVEMPEQVKPVENSTDVTEEHFKKSLQMLDKLAAIFEDHGTKLANRKKKANFRVLKAILFETEDTEKTFGKDEQKMLDLSRAIMYHRQIVEIFLMKQESKELLQEIKNEQK